MSQKYSQVNNDLDQDDKDKMVSDAVFYFLIADQKKTLIKRAELSKHCDISKKSKAVQDEVINAAINHLAKTFGIRVQELENRKGCYMLINQLVQNESDMELQHLEWSDKEEGQMGLTFTILGLIFMSNGKVSDETLFKFLKCLGLYEEDKGQKKDRRQVESDNPVVDELFDGDIKKFVNEILAGKQNYLKRERVMGPDPEVEQYEYSWGERAELEIKRSSVLKMICELYECSPKMFKEQYDKVKANEDIDLEEQE